MSGLEMPKSLIFSINVWNLGKRALIEFINLIFQDEDMNSITLNVFDYNVGAKKLYEKVGFKVVNITENPMKKYMMIMKKGEK